MVQAITAFRPYVSAVPSMVKQQRVNQIKLQRNQITDELRNGKISDIQAMAEKIALDSKLSDAKATASADRYVSEPLMIPKSNKENHVDNVHKNIMPANVQALEKEQKGKELSKFEKQQLVENQLQQLAYSNMAYHGLVAV